jgi:hypothetical protein
MKRTYSVSAALLLFGSSAVGQQSFLNTSAAQPSTGTFLFRQTVEYQKFGHDPSGLDRDIEQFRFNTQLSFGLTKDLTIIGQVPLYHRSVDSPAEGVSNDDFDLGDANITLKLRLWQHDTGPVDTMRLSLLAGLDLPIGQEPFGNGGWDPMIGAVFTAIRDRHGVNLAARYQFNTHQRSEAPIDVDGGIEDTLFVDAAYLFRLAPQQWAADIHGAWYAMAELSTTYETNGDVEVRLAPGIMYEARNWVIEAMVQVPVYDDLDHRPETDFVLGFGFRVLF